jgi:hypothetical protein
MRRGSHRPACFFLLFILSNLYNKDPSPPLQQSQIKEKKTPSAARQHHTQQAAVIKLPHAQLKNKRKK